MTKNNNEVWTSKQINDFSTADDMRISPFYSDGKTYGTPTWIWSVVVNDQLYVRAWNGQNSRWYRSAVQQRAGRMHLAGKNFEISFREVSDTELNDKVDAAYRRKYAGSAYLDSMVQARPKSSTLNIIPR
ncbi:DUF2255 family protein [Companilactobacillus mishanensis]|uniref:DUF2255 family protein n=1 Tax=Companilactobacillus mishanensis TaxID=2486008 RepID=UPI00129665F5|nr:DUF2255 family protein [Companilactobacillus mishanensis]MQS89818.1 DUF2255 family protein [Companilactobacillus mishanensis]